MLDSRLWQILKEPPEWLSINPDPIADRYNGRYLVIDGIPCALGKQLGQGAEAFVFELINLQDGDRMGVIKICRHAPGSAKYSAWAVPYRIETNPLSAVPDVEMYLARLIRVPGGLVKLQPYIAADPENDVASPYLSVPILQMAQQGKLEDALELANTFITQYGTRPALIEAKGQVLAALSQLDEAREILEQALDAYNELQSYARFRVSLVLADVLANIYSVGKGGTTLELKLPGGFIHRQTAFLDIKESAQDDTLQDREEYVLLEILSDEPYFIPALLRLADTLMETTGTHLFVEDVLRAVERIDPNSPDAKRRREYLIERYGSAMQTSQDDVSQDENPTHEMSLSPEELEKHEERLKDFDTYYLPEPEKGQLAEARYHSAIAHLQRGNLDAAILAARRAAELDERKVNYQLLLAEILDRQGEAEEALAVLQHAAEGDFFYEASVHEKLGDFYLLHEDFTKAEASYLRALHIDPETPWRIKLGLGRACGKLEKHKEAVRWLRLAYAESSQEPDAVLELVYALSWDSGSSKEEFQEALQIITAAVSEHPDLSRLLVCRAIMLTQIGSVEEAIDLLKNAIRLDPSHPFAADALRDLEELYNQQGKED